MTIPVMYTAGISIFVVGVIVGIMISVYTGTRIARKEDREIEFMIADAILEVDNGKEQETA